jgi:hypothetical protein
MPSTLTGGGSSAKESRDQAGTQEQDASSENASATENTTAASDAVSTAQSELPPTAPSNATASLAGSWSFALKDDLQRNVTLVLFQNGESVYGTGNMKEGNSTFQMAATGSLRSDGKGMDLDFITLGTIRLYKLDLGISGESASGNYQAFSANGQVVSGSAEGTLIAPM